MLDEIKASLVVRSISQSRPGVRVRGNQRGRGRTPSNL
jgi:hypothetical protein